jgi:hypothetical protein
MRPSALLQFLLGMKDWVFSYVWVGLGLISLSCSVWLIFTYKRWARGFPAFHQYLLWLTYIDISNSIADLVCSTYLFLDKNSGFFVHYGKYWKYIKDLSDRFAAWNEIFATLGLSVMFLGIVDFGWSLYQLQWKIMLCSLTFISITVGILSLHYELRGLLLIIGCLPFLTVVIYVYTIIRLRQMKFECTSETDSRKLTLKTVIERLMAFGSLYFITTIPFAIVTSIDPKSIILPKILDYMVILAFSWIGLGHLLIIKFVISPKEISNDPTPVEEDSILSLSFETPTLLHERSFTSEHYLAQTGPSLNLEITPLLGVSNYESLNQNSQREQFLNDWV